MSRPSPPRPLASPCAPRSSPSIPLLATVAFICLALRPVASQPVEIYGSSLGVKRPDSVNPYCSLCVTIFNTAEETIDKNQCHRTVPLNQQEACNYVFHHLRASRDAKLIDTLGCVDFTVKQTTGSGGEAGGEAGEGPPNYWGPKMCPGLIACNILEAESGGPLCGPALRVWGDFHPMYSWNRPRRPTTFDLYPKALQPAQPNLLPYAGVYPGNPDCALCTDMINTASMLKSLEGEAPMCKRVPASMLTRCKEVADQIFPKANAEKRDLIWIMNKGCVDTTTIAPMELVPLRCSGFVACNLIETPQGGPWCGQYLGQYGRMTAGRTAGTEAQQEHGIPAGGGG